MLNQVIEPLFFNNKKKSLTSRQAASLSLIFLMSVPLQRWSSGILIGFHSSAGQVISSLGSTPALVQWYSHWVPLQRWSSDILTGFRSRNGPVIMSLFSQDFTPVLVQWYSHWVPLQSWSSDNVTILTGFHSSAGPVIF